MEVQLIAPKMTISRSAKSEEHDKGQGMKQQKARALRACDNCRKRKVRCAGELEQCQNCVDQGVTCVYSLARRDRLREATEENGRLIALLKDLSLHVDDSGRQMIEGHLDVLWGDSSALAPMAVPETLGKHSREVSPSAKASRGSLGSRVSSSDGSEDIADVQNENLFGNNESRATGFVGRNSSVQWLRSLKKQMKSVDARGVSQARQHGRTDSSKDSAALKVGPHKLNERQQSKLKNSLRVSDSTFYLDGDDLEPDIMVDPYELPTPEMAEKLFGYYIHTIHASFPILPENFEEQFRKYIEAAKWDRQYQVPDEWRALLNLVFAIGAQYAYLVLAEWNPEERYDLLYMTRASRILRLDKIATSLPAPSLMFIQALGLLSLYYLTVGQVSRAWMMIGISLRFALAAGLHLQNDDPLAIPIKKETLIRTWWSLHSIESLICAIIGRPCIIPNDECTVPLPHLTPIDHPEGTTQSPPSGATQTLERGDSEKVAGSSFIGARVVIALIIQKSLARLYTPQLPVGSWDRIQRDITSLMGELDDWAIAARLTGLSPTDSYPETGMPREKLLLSFHYHSAKLLISRPCLCRLERRNKGQSDASVDFYQNTAEKCVQAAQAITNLFPNQLDLRFVYEKSPWWCIVHNIMQAVAVFLLKISLGGTHATHNGEALSKSVEKLLRWLRYIGARNDVAQRAYKVVLDIIETSALSVYINTSDNSAEQQSAMNRTQSFQAFSTPSTSDIFPDPSASSPSSNQSFPHAHYITTSTTVSPQMDIPMEPQQPLQAFGTSPFNYDFTLDFDSYMPSVFGNPFLNNFDQPNPISTTYLGTNNVSTNEAHNVPPSTLPTT